ncbi:MAG: methyltransferase domain-containing protein [ANME-2 cluster archaeon]|jgi:tRNA (adenine57-N1/adenine58-N1)-methyltransferase|nr:methyltransferase domain-containing protein [ANME-2 cluster archaeon]
MKQGEAVLLKGGGKRYIVIASDEDLHTDVGVFKLGQLLGMEYSDIIVSHLGFEMQIYHLRAADLFNSLKRTGAPISPKDIGMIMGHTGLNKEDTVLDAGTGSGILAIYLGLVARRVVTYEVREEFAEVARSNIALAGLTNVDFRSGDLVKEIRSLNETFDVVTLDMQAADKVVPEVLTVMKPGGYLVVFSPFFEQAKEVRMAINIEKFEEVVTLECTQREISFSERGTRPSTTKVGHTGFITFARAI